MVEGAEAHRCEAVAVVEEAHLEVGEDSVLAEEVAAEAEEDSLGVAQVDLLLEEEGRRGEVSVVDVVELGWLRKCLCRYWRLGIPIVRC